MRKQRLTRWFHSVLRGSERLPVWQRTVLPVVLVLLAMAMNVLLQRTGDDALFFSFFTGATVGCVALAGQKSGYASLFLAIAAELYLWRRDAAPGEHLDYSDYLRLAAFTFVGTFLIYLVDQLGTQVRLLYRQRETFKVTLRSIGDGVIATDLAGDVTFMNQTAVELTGWPLADALGRPLDEIFRIEDASTGEPLPSPAATALQTGETISLRNNTRLLRPDGSSIMISDSAAPIRGPEVQGAVLVFSDVTETYRIRKESVERERNLAWLLDAIPESVWSTDTEGKTIFLSENWRRYSGQDLQEIQKEGWDPLIHPEDRERVWETWGRSLREELPLYLELRLRGKDEQYRWHLSRGVPFRDEGGRVVRWFGTLTDIEAQKTAYIRAREREERMNMAFQAARLAAWELDAATNRMKVSEQMGPLLGEAAEFDPGDLEAFLRRVHPEDRAQVKAHFRAAVSARHEHRQEFRTVWPDGSVHWLADRGKAYGGDDGATRRVIGVVMDIDDRKLAQEIIAQSEARLFGLINSATDAIISIDEQERVTLFNPAAEQLFGVPASQALGRPLERFLPARYRDSHHEQIKQFGQSGVTSRTMSHHSKVRGQRADGDEFPIEASISQVKVGGQRMYTVILRDITERERTAESQSRLEAQLLQAQKMEAVGRLAGGIAHDFNNMLMVVRAQAELASLSLRPESPERERMGEILTATDRAASLTKQLLAFSRQQVMQPQLISVDSVLHDTGRMVARVIGEDIRLEVRSAPELHPILADPGQITQVLLNLAVNARDAMPDGGSLSIVAENHTVSEAEIFHEELPSGDYVRISVADNGQGMDPEVQAHLFEPFFTTKGPERGTGLGLATVHGIVAQSNGSIRFESAPGKGTTFFLFFPASEAATPAPASAPEANGGPRTGRVLLVEDDDVLRSVLAEFLVLLGYQVVVAHHGRMALEMIRSGGCKPDLVISDLVMPDMGGLELFQQLQVLLPGLKRILMSGYSDKPIRSPEELGPHTVYLQKPFRLDSLSQKISELGA